MKQILLDPAGRFIDGTALPHFGSISVSVEKCGHLSLVNRILFFDPR